MGEKSFSVTPPLSFVATPTLSRFTVLLRPQPLTSMRLPPDVPEVREASAAAAFKLLIKFLRTLFAGSLS